jgi:cytidyltransferase-like protein
MEKYLISQILEYKSNWNYKDIKLEKTKYGLSNQNYYVKYKGKYTYFIKYYTKKNSNIIEPKILFSFNNGHIEEYINGRNLNISDYNGDTFKKIAILIRNFHNKYNLNHNDVNKTNIMVREDDSLDLIDYEYVGELDIYYDIANFFFDCLYDFDSKEWFKFNLNQFPTERHFNLFCKEYFQTEDMNLISSHRINILNKMKKVIEFWIKWTEPYNEIDYSLYKLYLNKLLNINFNDLLEKKVIYCDGTFDLLHTGHLNFFKKAKSLDCKKLIIGVLSDKDVESYKRIPILNVDTRSEMVKSLKLIDEVVSNCPFNRIENDFLDFYGIDLVAYGGDPKLEDPLSTWQYHYSIPLEQNCLKLIPYSEGISTSEILNRIK